MGRQDGDPFLFSPAHGRAGCLSWGRAKGSFSGREQGMGCRAILLQASAERMKGKCEVVRARGQRGLWADVPGGWDKGQALPVLPLSVPVLGQ